MARQTDVRYIRFYTDGSAARKVDIVKPAPRTTLPQRSKKQKKIVLFVDPVAILGIVTAVVMVIIMTASLFMLNAAEDRATAMEHRVEVMQQENEALQAEYEASYDIEQVEQTALALGMVPKDQVEHIQLYVDVPVNSETPGTWDQIWSFLTGLFA